MSASTIKAVVALVLTGLGSAIVVGFRTPDATTLGSTATTTTSHSTVATATGAPGSTSAGNGNGNGSANGTTAAPAATSAAGGAYADGTWTGSAVQEPWGAFQVQAVVSGGKITSVVLVQSPQDSHSNQINNRAVPSLTQAAIGAQSSKIDMISGATWTSQSYVTSLQAALDQAKTAALTAAGTAA